MDTGLKSKVKLLVMKIIRKTMSKVDKEVDITKLRDKYHRKKLKFFAINVVDLDYSAVIDTTGDKLELIGEGAVRDYDGMPEINLVVYLNSATLFDIVEGVTEPLKAYLLGRIEITKTDKNTFATDIKLLNEVFNYMYNNVHK